MSNPPSSAEHCANCDFGDTSPDPDTVMLEGAMVQIHLRDLEGQLPPNRQNATEVMLEQGLSSKRVMMAKACAVRIFRGECCRYGYIVDIGGTSVKLFNKNVN